MATTDTAAFWGQRRTSTRSGGPPKAGALQGRADALVIFGITGDLARVMTFTSLYRLEKRGLLDCPIVGVALQDWTLQHLVDHARQCIIATGEPLEDAVFARFADKLSYVHGNFTDPATYGRLAAAVKAARLPVFYLEVPPSLFATVVRGLSSVGLSEDARIVIEKPFGYDLASARDLGESLHALIDEDQIYRIDHFLGAMSVEDILYLRFNNTAFEPIWNRNYISSVQITMAEEFGIADRGHFYDPVGALRDVVQNHIMQVLTMVAMEPPIGGSVKSIHDHRREVLVAMADADPANYVRGQYEGYRSVSGVAPGSETETFAALRLEIDNWRWSGVPFFIRTGKALPSTVTEVRIVFRTTPWLGFTPKGSPRPDPNQIVLRIGPTAPGARMLLMAKQATSWDRRVVDLDMTFASQGGEGPTPYETLLDAALEGHPGLFAREDSIEEAWRVLQPLLDNRPPVQIYPQHTWGPEAANQLVRSYGGWNEPWLPK